MLGHFISVSLIYLLVACGLIETHKNDFEVLFGIFIPEFYEARRKGTTRRAPVGGKIESDVFPFQGGGVDLLSRRVMKNRRGVDSLRKVLPHAAWAKKEGHKRVGGRENSLHLERSVSG